jgi:hypothetical protein
LTIIDVLQGAGLDTADLSKIAAWCLERLADELGETGTPHDAVEILAALDEPIGALNELYNNGAANFGSNDLRASQATSAALDRAALATARLALDNQRCTAAVRAEIAVWDGLAERASAPERTQAASAPSPALADTLSAPSAATAASRNPAHTDGNTVSGPAAASGPRRGRQ